MIGRGGCTIAARPHDRHPRAADGTDLVGRLDPAVARWVPRTGLLRQQGEWGNLPEGEAFACPASVEGTLTGAVWESDVHVDVVPIDVDLEVDGVPLTRRGVYVEEVLEA